MDYIYRDVTISKMSKNVCTNFLHGVALSKGTIVSSFSMANGFPDNKVSFHSIFFRVKFNDQTGVDTFERISGLTTEEPEKVQCN